MTLNDFDRELHNQSESVLSGALAAMERAAVMARKIAIQTGTAVVLVENGKIVRRTAAELQIEMARNSL